MEPKIVENEYDSSQTHPCVRGNENAKAITGYSGVHRCLLSLLLNSQ
jgi:hypothetical protein